MSSPIRLAVTALTGLVVAGKAKASGSGFLLSSVQDVTSDFMKAVVEKAEHHGGSFIIRGDSKRWKVTVVAVEASDET